MSLFCFFKWSTPIFLSPCLQFIDWLFSITEGPKLGFSETALLTAKGETLCFSQIIILYQSLISVLKCVDNKKESITMWFDKKQSIITWFDKKQRIVTWFDKKQRIVTWCVQYSWNLSFVSRSVLATLMALRSSSEFKKKGVWTRAYGWWSHWKLWVTKDTICLHAYSVKL